MRETTMSKIRMKFGFLCYNLFFTLFAFTFHGTLETFRSSCLIEKDVDSSIRFFLISTISSSQGCQEWSHIHVVNRLTKSKWRRIDMDITKNKYYRLIILSGSVLQHAIVHRKIYYAFFILFSALDCKK